MLKSAEGMLKSAEGGMLKSAEGMLKSAAHRTEREQKYTLNVKGTQTSVSKTLTSALSGFCATFHVALSYYLTKEL